MLPEWDREKYPYSYITTGYSDKSRISFVLVKEKVMIPKHNYFPIHTRQQHLLSGDGTTWGAPTKTQDGLDIPIWANYDIYINETGALYLAASDPTPIYE